MAVITGTPGNDTITPESVSTGVTGGIPSDAPDTINGLAGNDFADGGGGDDTIDGGTGFNVLIGGPGNDLLTGERSDLLLSFHTADYSTAESGIDVRLTGAIATSLVKARDANDTSVGTDRIGNIYDFNGTRYDDTFIIEADFDRGIPGSSNSTIITPGPGNDTIEGQSNDVGVSYFDSPRPIDIDFTKNSVADGFGTTDTFSGINWVSGTEFADRMRGTDNPDPELENFIGGPGNDFIDGRGGDDQADYRGAGPSHGAVVNLSMGKAVDDGFGGTDTLANIELVLGTDFADQITGSQNAESFFGEPGNDRLFGNGGNDGLEGGSGNDTISGGTGDDYLDGGSGNDTLSGGRGLDQLWGRSGNDVFDYDLVVDSRPGGTLRDVINDFAGVGGTTRTEYIDLSTIDANTGAGGNQTFTFRGTQAFNAPGQVRVVASGSNTVIQGSTDADTAAEFEIQVNDGAVLPSAWKPLDFLL